MEFRQEPRCGEVYNIGGGRPNALFILETIAMLREMGFDLKYRYSTENRIGDHICYITDTTKLRSHFPNWSQKYTVEQIIEEIVEQNLAALKRQSPDRELIHA